MQLFYDPRDDEYHEARGSRILYWLDDLGAKPLEEAASGEEGFLFAGARGLADYEQLVAKHAGVRDRPGERAPLLQLDTVLEALARAGAEVPTPKTWRLEIDCPQPDDLPFPLFVRTTHSSWKLGGRASRVHSPKELETEIAELRRVFGWNAVILAREWVELAEAGRNRNGPVPQELRVWVVDHVPRAWSFHYLNVLNQPRGFPPAAEELQILGRLSATVARAFASRLVAADFARTVSGDWVFIEAGPGSCAGTAHEAVFKSVAQKLLGETLPIPDDSVGGAFTEVFKEPLAR